MLVQGFAQLVKDAIDELWQDADTQCGSEQ